jgi:hypothetical protein
MKLGLRYGTPRFERGWSAWPATATVRGAAPPPA